MHWSTRVFLVLLRLVIGWHFFFEGLAKRELPTWSSEPYLRESVGPAAPLYRNILGDSIADRLTPREATTPRERLPLELHRDWQAYVDAFAQNYDLNDEQQIQARVK